MNPATEKPKTSRRATRLVLFFDQAKCKPGMHFTDTEGRKYRVREDGAYQRISKGLSKKERRQFRMAQLQAQLQLTEETMEETNGAAVMEEAPAELDRPPIVSMNDLPVCPHCGEDPARLAIKENMIGSYLVAMVFCGNSQCRKIHTVIPLGKQVPQRSGLILPRA